MAPSLFRPMPKLDVRPERITWPDGDFTILAWAGERENPTGPIAILVHGLTGDFTSKYLRGTARQLIDRGFRTCLLQLRGAGPEVNLSRRFYNHGDTEDLKAVWHRLRAAEPQTALVAAGWSLGGNVVLKALAEDGAAAPIARAATASVPFLLEPCVVKLKKGTARLYQHYLLSDLKRTLVRKHKKLGIPVPPGANLKAALAARDFYELDDAYTVPNNGYKSSRDYYRRAACGNFIGHITVPTLIVQAMDDPFMTPDIVPGPEALAPAVTLELARRGGHVGFIGRGPYGRPVAWLESHFADWLAAGVELAETKPAVNHRARVTRRAAPGKRVAG